ncbi:MAG: BMP family ABC transporter substrate-binding protein [Acidimicrobiales bacterium]
MRRMKQVLAVLAAITMAAAPAVVVPSVAAASPAVVNGAAGSQWTVKNPFKVGFIYVGAPSDAGWTHAQDVGRLEVQKYFGGRVETLYKEDVPEGPQCAQVITQLVDAGAKLIFATSYGYQPELVAAAAKYPDVLFEQATGTTVTKTLAEYYGAGENGDFLSGMAAGAAALAGNNKIGFVLPYPIPECLREVDAFTMGAQLMDPKATVQVVWTNTWFAPATERQAAESLVADGVSVLADGQDSPTTGQVAEAHGLKWTGYDSNQESFAPNSWLTATTYNWGPYYIQETAAAMNGTWKSHFWYGSLADHFVIMAPFGKSVAPATRSAILAKEQQIIKGTFDPFTGPIYAQNGKLVVPKGVTLSVMQKYSITWFVKGVLGNPKG